jgi:hypothetical protein
MQLPSLQISAGHGKIGIKTDRPQIQIQQQEPALSIKQQHTQIEVSHQHSQLSIDQREAFASANSKHIYRLNEEFAAKAINHASQIAGKYAREGDQLMRIENGGEVIPQLAKANSLLFSDKEVNIGLMPRPFSMKFDYQPSKLNFNVSNSAPQISVTRREPTIQHRRWQTDVYMREKNHIKFQAVGLQVNRQI